MPPTIGMAGCEHPRGKRHMVTATTLAAQRIAIVALSEVGADGVNLLNCCGAEAWQTVFHFSCT